MADKKKKSIVYFDIDGTLLDSYRNIRLSDATAAAIHELKRNGHLVAVNTGRSFGFIPPEVMALEFDAYIAGCGTYVSYHGETIINKLFSQAETARIIEVFRKEENDMIMEGPEHVYFEEVGYDPVIVADTKLMFNETHSLKHLEEDVILANKISFIVKSPEKDRRIRAALSDIMSFVIYPQHLREGLPHGYTKGSGMQTLEQIIGDVRSYAFGDSVNDLDMLEYADVGVAMGNGHDIVKDMADLVTVPLAEDGVAVMLKQLNLIEGAYLP